MRVRLSSAIGALAVAAALGCNGSDEAAGGEPTTARASAVTEAAPRRAARNQPGAFRESDVGQQAGAVPQGVSRPALRLPGQPRGKAVVKPTLAPTVGSPPPAPPAQYVAKQSEYLRQWNELQPTLAHLPEAEQDARRAALKRQVLGE